MQDGFLFTSESVTEGHPDKIADQISDAILDEAISQDKYARVACETLVTTGMVFIAGEISINGYIDFPSVIRRTVQGIGYDDSSIGFDYKSCAILCAIDPQSPDISQGVDTGGAGDQGLMFGFACDETPELMPLPITMAHKLAKRLAEARKTGALGWLRPDGKSQITVEYRNGEPTRIHTVVISAQHAPQVDNSEIREGIIDEVINKVLPEHLRDERTILHINPTGRFVTGGPQGDCGLTGRKIIVDTYGGMSSHGGGAFSGKDPTKVDRSACYMARHIAKNIVSAKLARKVTVQLAYAIGIADPVSVYIDTHGTGQVSDSRLALAVRDIFPLTPGGIIQHLSLRTPIYLPSASYGHFGRHEKSFTWEALDHSEDLESYFRN